MHSEDFERIMLALSSAGVITLDQAVAAAKDYANQRAEIERAAAERAEKLIGDKLFTRFMLASDPVLGMPLMFWALILFFVLTWVF